MYKDDSRNSSVQIIKGSRQWESRGVRNVSICPNLAQTAAIDVRFSINFAVVFDFIYFLFRPVKQNEYAMSYRIGETLP